MNGKCYWLVKPDSYLVINKILNSLFSKSDIDFFITKHQNGIYITYDPEMSSDYHKWGHMPYPEYDNNNGNYIVDMKQSKWWLRRNGYKYKGEISRKSKLEKLEKIQN